jgi:hypothetical protein
MCSFEKVLANLDEDWVQNRLKKCPKDIFVCLDNVIPNQPLRDLDRLGITRLPHPSYSQDLASCDFELFRMLRTKLEGCKSANSIEVMTEVCTIFSNIPLN